MADCLFCASSRARPRPTSCSTTDDFVAFLDTRPVFKGHVLLVPREHVVTLPDLPAELRDAFLAAAQRLASAVVAGLGAQGSFVAMNNVVSQSVPHLHLHVVPRTKGDGLRGFFWPRTKYADDAEQAEYAGRLRVALATSDRASSTPRPLDCRRPDHRHAGRNHGSFRRTGRRHHRCSAGHRLRHRQALRRGGRRRSPSSTSTRRHAAEAAGRLPRRAPRRPSASAATSPTLRRVEAAVARVVEELGGMHILVNNAGITRDNLLFKMTEDDWDLVMNVHLKGAFLMSQAAQKHFVDAEVRQDPQPLQRLGARQPRPGQLLGREDGHPGLHPHARHRARPVRRQRQRDRPRLHRHRDDRRDRARLKIDVEEFRRLNAEANPVKRVGHPEDIAAAAASAPATTTVAVGASASFEAAAAT